MKKQTMYNRLKQEYTKLNQRIQKAMQTGRFYGYTEFKQQQLLGRLKRFSFQIKQLGAGVAVVTALGMATPAVGQVVNLVERTGADNPFDGLYSGQAYFRPSFVDIDGDGDMDMFQNSAGLAGDPLFFRNTGSDTNAVFSLVTAANNPLVGLNAVVYSSFVDIDGDGDMDVFSGAYAQYYGADKVEYYENTGTALVPQFTKKTGVDNPLDALMSLTMWIQPFFVDIDNDGDMDCFVTGIENYKADILFYENVGTATAPSFSIQTGINNPLDVFTDTIGGLGSTASIQFEDMDNDGDKDAFINSPSVNNNNIFQYYENTGTATNPVFSMNLTTPLDSIPSVNSKFSTALVDIDGDGDIDVLESTTTFQNNSFGFYENCDIKLNLVNIKEQELLIYPNPSKGVLYFDKPLTGSCELTTVDGKQLFAQGLENAQQIILPKLNEGVFFLKIETENKRIVEKILIRN
ncbi:T9SS type A sorting domain-containing protein [Aureispira sp. CCB-E]|uniref:T9SS type A sorting domain-containing protein n=1 Tax=Aureispira sp. CCB-E TaxID=3051121 RepID=UPI002868EF95|nr:T9SS type A sorting domain-containing protein [Aureispira sp. CCB-E]WMX16718.1 T9SS type A sorting domain-containing protein [Aureispira sp. CCB-E]